MKELETYIKERIRAELKLCQVKEIDEYRLDRVCRIAMSEHFELITCCAVAEYCLLSADYDKAKYHNKKYRKVLKEQL